MRNLLLNRSIKKATRKADYKGWASAKTVFVLLDEHENEPRPELTELENELKNEGKTVSHLIFSSAKKPKENIPEFTYFKGDTNLGGQPKKSIINMLPKNIDVLIDWTKMTDCPNDFVAVATQAHFKIGVDRDLPCFDVVIQGHNSMPSKVIDELLKYLKLINK